MTPKRTRRRYTAEFKAEVALAALTERQPLADLAARYQLATAQITRWKRQLREQAAQVFAEAPAVLSTAPDVEPLYAAIRRLQMENALLKKMLGPCQQLSNVPWSKRRTQPTAQCRPAVKPWAWPAAVFTTSPGAKAPATWN
jgi:transposase